ncbi:hypothetical protein [uncultured Aquimarina sp.]|uniref:hypothetical protein n=1 Tax=uncultured Aquimarina sp. TaxID=575652 RepID=UPI00260E6A62|nr:hypothetical protein [uncultured Aquimarina sp.]
MRFNLILIFLFVIQSISSQENEIFKVKINKKEKSEFNSDYRKFKHRYSYFYEDENFIVKDSCRGEFGGVIEFRNKENNNVYVAKATCPSSLIKMNGKYYLITSLAHRSGAFGVYEIGDPKELTELKTTDSKRDKFFKKKSNSGLKKLYKKIGGTILVSFPYKDKLYFITSDKDGTYLTEMKNSELIKIMKLLDYKVYTYETGVKTTYDNHYVNNFQIVYSKEIGFFDIQNNVININLYK